MEPAPSSQPDSQRARVAGVVADLRARRAAGEVVSDEELLAAHPDLRALLMAELSKLRLVQRARRLAGDPGHGTTRLPSGAAGDAPPLLLVDQIPGYEIRGEIHRGGQGVVFHAVQISTGREVAIKVLRQGPFGNIEDRQRFDREVRVLSALKHPNIVAIHDGGVAHGHAYFVMDYIAGETLDLYVARTRCSVDTLLAMFVKICAAVAAAQLRGIIHRDLKPGNIRVDRAGEPHVLDFGLAKIDPAAVDSAAEHAPLPGASPAAPSFTQTGQFLGSLPWASPEQAEGLAAKVDIRTDVYSLGVVLYQSLTGRFPYPVNGGFRVVLNNILNSAPVRPASVRREINDEVETILLKCLQKEPERRYQGAAELAADLRRYLSGAPIDAKRDSHIYVLRKQLVRHRLPVAAAVAVLISLVYGVVSAQRASWRAQQAEAIAVRRAEREAHLREQLEWDSYRACLVAADAALNANDTTMATARLEAAPPHLRGWEWNYLHSRLDQSLATYPVATPVLDRFALSPDGRTAYTIRGDGALVQLHLQTGQTQALGRGDTVGITALALDRTGRRLALISTGGFLSIHDAASGQRLLHIQIHDRGSTVALAFSPDGSALATGNWHGDDNHIRLWDATTGALQADFSSPDSDVTDLVFSPDGRRLASAHSKPHAGLRLWNVESRQLVFESDYEGFDVARVAFSPNGDRIAVSSQDSIIRLYDSGSGRVLQTLSGHAAKVRAAAFSADGRRLASVSVDQTLRIWDLDSGTSITCQRGHLNGGEQVAFLPGDREVLTFSRTDAAFRRWGTAPVAEPLTFDTGKYFVLQVAFTADSRQLFANQRRWDAHTGEELEPLQPRPQWAGNAWINADAGLEWVADSAGGGALLREGQELLRERSALVFRPVISPDGTRVAIGLARGTLRIHRLRDGAQIQELPFEARTAIAVEFNATGRQFVLWTNDGRWSIWDVESGRQVVAHRQSESEIVNASFSADGRLLATASYDGTARIFDAQSGQELQVLRAAGVPPGDLRVVWCVAFSPDGTRLATGSKDRRIRLWDVVTGQELCALTRHGGTIMCLAWSPDGTQLASGGYEGAVCLWDALSRAERQAQVTASAPAGK